MQKSYLNSSIFIHTFLDYIASHYIWRVILFLYRFLNVPSNLSNEIEFQEIFEL